jgi:hypothetical protein
MPESKPVVAAGGTPKVGLSTPSAITIWWSGRKYEFADEKAALAAGFHLEDHLHREGKS